MAFKGTLKEFKVPDILQLFSLQRKTGILTFTSTDSFITLIFEDGLIVGVDAFPKKLEMRVGNVLVKQDFISDEMLQRALSIQKRTNQKIGEILIGMGLTNQDTIKEALETQAIEIILSLFKWKKGGYNFKVMERLDKSAKTISPITTDNIIMEGVQMLDEWPHIKKLIPNESLVFEPVPIDSKNIEIIDEYDDEVPDDEKIYLSKTEANVLKYINGKNSVKDLVELGIFTQYKIYKSLYNLINKSIVKHKEKSEPEELDLEQMYNELKVSSSVKINRLFYLLLAFLLLIFGFYFFKPLNPVNKENILLKKNLYKNFVLEKNQELHLFDD